MLGLLERHRLVELVGPGGVGKTALAVAAARAVVGPSAPSHGVWLVRLDMASNGTEVVDALVAALRVSGGEAALWDVLGTWSTLLVLDNCEHVVDAAAELVERVLACGVGVRVLATSQLALGVDAEVVHDVVPLALDDAVELFGRRATRSGDPEPLVELCRSLDGLPLAIELAAARTRTLSVDEISRRLDDRFTVLADPNSRRPERRRALRATIAWSYDLLFPDDRRGLWALSVFAGSAPPAAVEHVLGSLGVPAGAGMDVVGRLVGRSLVVVDDAGGRVRYRLLDSIREFARDALDDSGEAEVALAAHAAWFVGRAEGSTEGVRSADQALHLDEARAERANLDAALAWTAINDPDSGLTLANGFAWAWMVLGDTRGADRLRAALDAAGTGASASAAAEALLAIAWIEASTGDLAAAAAHLAEVDALAADLGDDDLRGRAAYYLAYVVSHDGDFVAATAHTRRSEQLLGDDRHWDLAANALFAARAAISSADADASERELAAADRWLRLVDDPWLHVRRDAMLGELARVRRRFDDAVRHIERAAAVSARRGYRQTEAYQMSCLGRARALAGDPAAGADALDVSVAQAEAIGDHRMAALARVHVGRIRRGLGDDAAARAALDAAHRWHTRAGGGEQAALGECLHAAMDAADGTPGAADRLDAVLATARASHEAHVEVFALDAVARIATISGDLDRAAGLLAEADVAMESAAHFIGESDRADARWVRDALSRR